MNMIEHEADLLYAHAGFDAAVSAFCQKLTENYANRDLPHVAFAQMERWVLAMLILYLGGITPRRRRTGATLGTLVSICAKGDYGSRKLVRDIMAYFLTKGLVVEHDMPGDRRKKAIFATDKLIRTFEADVMTRLSVLDIVSDKPLLLVDYIDSANVLMRFVDGHVGSFLSDAHRITDDFPEVQQFLAHAHGYVVFLHILGASHKEADGRIIAHTSRAAIARKLAVSRPHVAKLVNAASEKGWLITDRQTKEFELMPAFYARARLWIAHELAMLKHSLSYQQNAHTPADEIKVRAQKSDESLLAAHQ
jgi:hypothetical protein